MIFHSYVSLPEGKYPKMSSEGTWRTFLRQLTWENRKVTWENHPKNGDIMVGQLTIGTYFNIFYINISNKNMEHHRNLVEEGLSNNEFVVWSSGNYFREEHP